MLCIALLDGILRTLVQIDEELMNAAGAFSIDQVYTI